MRRPRSQPWMIAADLEAAAQAIASARMLIDAIHDTAIPEIEAIKGTEFIDRDMVKDLLALSEKYQAIADAEVE